MYKENTGWYEKIVPLEGDSQSLKLKKFPNNFIVKEDPYWYQFTEKPSDRKNFVDKQTILEILRRYQIHDHYIKNKRCITAILLAGI
jgi:hypothetical protein